MTSTSDRAYVWGWLPGTSSPVPVGVLARATDNRFSFAYGNRYLERSDAIALYGLPLREGFVAPPDGWDLAPCLRDASPDAWGRRVILDRLLGRRGPDAETSDLDELTYLLESSSNRVGALDLQHSASEYVPREHATDLTATYDAALSLDAGQELSDDMRAALESGTGIGGARPKAYLRLPDGREVVAKFAMSDDPYPVVQAEGVAIELARKAGITVPDSWVERVSGREVLLAERFDRTPPGGRRMVVSALTFTGESEGTARYVTYGDIRDTLLREGVSGNVSADLYARIAFNIAIGNTDDHARNHAAFWDGRTLELTPAYDLSPSPRSGETATLALAYDSRGNKGANLATLVEAAHEYGLDRRQAVDIIDNIVTTVHDHWSQAADLARLATAERNYLWGRQFLNRGVLYGYQDDKFLVEGLVGLRVKVPDSPAPAVKAAPDVPDRAQQSTDDRHWVAPHSRNGLPVVGHWARNPRQG